MKKILLILMFLFSTVAAFSQILFTVEDISAIEKQTFRGVGQSILCLENTSIYVVTETPSGAANGSTIIQILGTTKFAEVEVDLSTGGGGTDDQTAAEVSFTPTGNITSDNVQSMGEELQTQIDAAQAALGITNGAQNFGSFTGSTLSDNETAKVLFQELEDALEGVDGTADGSTNEVSLYILAGQSNALGQGENSDLTQSQKNVHTNLLMYNGTRFVPLHVDAGDNNFPGVEGQDWHGPEIGMQEYLESQNETAYLVKYAVGSTAIASWLPGTDNYNTLINERSVPAIKQLFSQGLKPKIYFFWMQGESDAIGGTTATYQSNLSVLRDSIKAKFGNTTPFIAAQIIPTLSDANVINTAISNVADAFFSTSSFSNDGLHYDFEGLNDLGRQFIIESTSFNPTAPENIFDQSGFNAFATGWEYNGQDQRVFFGEEELDSRIIVSAERESTKMKLLNTASGAASQLTLINNSQNAGALGLSISTSSNNFLYADKPLSFSSILKENIENNSFSGITNIFSIPNSTSNPATLNSPLVLNGAYLTGSFIFSTTGNGVFGTTSVLSPSARLVVKSSSNVISNNVVSFFNSDNTPLCEFTSAGGLSVGQNNHLSFAGADGTISAKTGYQVANQAPEGNYLRGDGTNFVSAAIQESDLPTRSASDVTITDAGGYFDNNSAESALQQLGSLNSPTTLRGSAALDFPSTSAQSSEDLTITVSGAALGDVVSLGVSNAAVSVNTNYTAWVSAVDTVTVRLNNYSLSTVDPAGGTFRVMVFKY